MFNPLKIKITALIILVLASAILFFVKIKVHKNENIKNEQKQELSASSQLSTDVLKKLIPAETDSIMFRYGIKKEWIRDVSDKPVQEKTKKEKPKKEIKNPKLPEHKIITASDVMWFDKEVSLPKDFPFAELDLDISIFLRSLNFDNITYEDPKTNNQLMNIYHSADSSKKILAKINFVYSDKIKRETADICIVLDNIDNLSRAQLEKILNCTEKFSMILPDNIDKPDIQTLVIESKRDYLVKADIGTPEDITPEFKTDMSEKDWKTKVRSICYEYDKAAGVIMANPKMQYKYENEIIDEFQKFTLKAFKDTILIKFNTNEKDKKKIYDLFTNILKKANSGNRSQIYLVNFSDDDFWNYVNEVHNLKKRGYKFFTFSEILKRRNKIIENLVQ